MTDRSNLTKLYPSVTGRTDNMSYHVNKIASSHMTVKLTIGGILIITAILTIPVFMAVWLMNYLNQSGNALSLASSIPSIMIALALWAGVLYLSVMAILKRLSKVRTDGVMFLWIYALCGVPVAQLIFNLYQKFNGGVAEAFPLMVMLFVENLIFVSAILLVTRTDKLSGGAKTALLIVTITIGILATIVSGA
ncbi:hypothetical protein COV88_01270 [Candidatus Saccharibacteria bacterium CG11_big_fil_rev_8_21_14_0_20_41_19]|nr:hypothetical protein [Candidatus Saccharibacteria bacterium]OIP86319.1 MAG: hypothetical protein AUK57_00915 [Candidatus Saccharibacteria bacterium CG2_30_41_52]PIQ71099.1 MAG: hypothetical protein COV88_01270 [Candidatus Saccharibacteria bacterium CG11_big_fil_rev_8_21_14_0_20_41_19]PIZ59916.1 MAG: hypothetical protein COY18_02030 [Candidatus Saccharibacteria bacterium CG_4_10_14_0_2_um_filter_41_11]PJC29373.1 MAG: hypothetical protein CO052_03720 [Candidatus Saccharibacteria bacterium CG_4